MDDVAAMGASQRMALCDQRMKLKPGYAKGFSSAALPASAVMPRRKVRVLRVNSAFWLAVEVIDPRAVGSASARLPARTVTSTDRKSGAMPAMNGLQSFVSDPFQ